MYLKGTIELNKFQIYSLVIEEGLLSVGFEWLIWLVSSDNPVTCIFGVEEYAEYCR
jgi:hypothetical protein